MPWRDHNRLLAIPCISSSTLRLQPPPRFACLSSRKHNPEIPTRHKSVSITQRLSPPRPTPRRFGLARYGRDSTPARRSTSSDRDRWPAYTVPPPRLHRPVANKLQQGSR